MTNPDLLLALAEDIADGGDRIYGNALYLNQDSLVLAKYSGANFVFRLTTAEQILFVLFVREFILTDGEL